MSDSYYGPQRGQGYRQDDRKVPRHAYSGGFRGGGGGRGFGHHNQKFQNGFHDRKRSDYPRHPVKREQRIKRKKEHRPPTPTPIPTAQRSSPLKSMKVDDESFRRRERLMEVQSNPVMKERLLLYNKLSMEDKVDLFIDNVTLPPLDIPPHWQEKKEKAKVKTEQFIRDEMLPSDDVCETGSLSSGYSSDGMYGSQRHNQAPSEKPYMDFLNSLTYCPPMTIGFHACSFGAISYDKWCYCPCEKSKMKKWRQFVEMNHFLEETPDTATSNYICDMKGPKPPHEFLKHVESLAAAHCKAHRIIYKYLEYLYENYHAPGHRHIAFEHYNSDQYKASEKIITRKVAKVFEKLKEDAEEKMLYKEKLMKMEKKMEQLEKVNLEQSVKLKEKQELKTRLRMNEEEQRRVVKYSIEEYGLQFRNIQSYMKSIIWSGDEFLDDSYAIQLEIPNDFHISDLFQKLYNKLNSKPAMRDYKELRRRLRRHYTGELEFPKSYGNISFALFHEPGEKLDGKDFDIDFERRMLAKLNTSRWAIHFKVDKEVVQKSRKLKKEIEAVDEGGPSRQFFEKLWSQLADLTLLSRSYDKQIHLFELDEAGLMPLSDSNLEYYFKREELKQVGAYFVAFGRLMAHCLLSGTENRLLIPSHILPGLYQNLLFRGIDPTDKEYNTDTLVDDTCALMGLRKEDRESKDRNKSPDSLLLRLELQDTPDEDLNKKFREKIHERFVKDRSLFVKNFTKGASLGESNCEIVKWELFMKSLPSKAMNEILFAQQAITKQDLVDEDGNLRFILFKNVDADAHHIERVQALQIVQDKLISEFTQLLVEKASDSSDYLNRFVYFCTGHSYIPNIESNPDYKIWIEFDTRKLSDSLPVVHTCTKELVIPATAYEGKADIFQEKLDQAMEWCSGKFDMN